MEHSGLGLWFFVLIVLLLSTAYFSRLLIKKFGLPSTDVRIKDLASL